MHAGGSIRPHGQPLALVFHMAAPAADLVQAALHNEQVFFSAHQHASQTPLVIKGQLVQLGAAAGQALKPLLLAGHIPAAKDGVVQMILHPGVVQAVQIGQLQHPAALVAQHIHVIFQRHHVAGEGAGLVHTEQVHAAEALHGVDGLDHRLLFAHGRAALGQAGVHHHGQQLRGEPHRHRQGKQEGRQPVALGQPAGGKHHRDQHRHKADQHPGNGVRAPVKAVFPLRARGGKAAVDRIGPHRQHDALAKAAHHGGAQKGHVLVIGGGLCGAGAQGDGPLFQHAALAGDHRLGDEQVLRFGKADVRWYPVPGRQPHPVAHHQLGGAKLGPPARPQHPHSGGDHAGEVVRHPFGPQLLHKTHRPADEQHTQHDEHGGQVSAEVGGQQHIGNKGDGGQHQQYHGKGGHKGPPQPVEHRVRPAARHHVGAPAAAAILHLPGVVALACDLKIAPERLGFGTGIFRNAPVNGPVLFHVRHLPGFLPFIIP